MEKPTKEVEVRYRAEFVDRIEVPVDWEWDGTLDSILKRTDMPYDDGSLVDWSVNGR